MRTVMVALAAGISVALMVSALWCWQHAAGVAAGYSQPVVVAWAVRLLAVGFAAAAQALLTSQVVAKIYGHTRMERGMTFGATMLVTLMVCTALALGLAGR